MLELNEMHKQILKNLNNRTSGVSLAAAINGCSLKEGMAAIQELINHGMVQTYTIKNNNQNYSFTMYRRVYRGDK